MTTDADQLRAMVDPATVLPWVWPTGDIKTPMTRQFSLGVERALPSDIVIRVDGIYSQGRNLLIERSLNLFDFTDPAAVPLYPQLGFVGQILSEGMANAKMLLVDVRKTFSRGWVSVNYTLADRQNTNDVWQDFVTQIDPNNEDFSSLLGPAIWDERHRLVGIGHIEILDALGVTGKTIYSSARPYNALTGTDDNFDGFFNDVAPGEGRNSRRGPDFFLTDLSITWNAMPVGGRNIGLMFNVYNVFNTTNLDPESVVDDLLSESFGQALAARHKRQVELGVQIR